MNTRESNAQERSYYIRPGLVSVSDALGFGVLTLVLRITVISENQKEVNTSKSDAGFTSSVALFSIDRDVGKTHKRKCTRKVRGNRIAGEKEKAGARMCVVCRWN